MKLFHRTLLFFFFCISTLVHAHESRPAFLEIRQTGEDTYKTLWKVPAAGPNKRLGLYVRFPSDCLIKTTRDTVFVGGAFIERSSIRRSGGLAGAEIFIEGLSRTLTDVLVRIERIDGSTQIARLTPASPSFTVVETPNSIQVATTYTILGIQHILEGIDHLLFVACLMLVAGINRKLLITITGFTVAHSLTLALAALGVVNVPVPPVEAVIALSIVFLATEIARKDRQSLTYRYPVTVSVSFGLLHGFGFAAVLNKIGLPQTEIPTALLFFNVGVEIGQILFIFAVITIFWIVKKLSAIAIPDFQLSNFPIFQTLTVYIIGTLATFWMMQRIASFWA